MNVLIGLIFVVVLIILAFTLPFIGIPCLLVFVFVCIRNAKSQKGKASENSAPINVDISDIPHTANSVAIANKYKRTKSYSDCSRFFQRFDESYNKVLGYEWFLVCVRYVKFPQYNSIAQRLYNIRHARNVTQFDAAKLSCISPSTLSSYENGYTTPQGNTLKSLAYAYSVPVSFIVSGFADDFKEHVNLCYRYGERAYLDGLIISVRAASGIFPDMLTSEDRTACVLVNDNLSLKLDLFGVQAKATEALKGEVKSDILARLEAGDIKQSELYKSMEENRLIVIGVVKELADSGIISKEKQGNTYILSLIKG